MVTKCDLCKKNIKDDETITIRVGFSLRAELCEKCGVPIIKFLKKHKFILSEKYAH